MKSGFAAAFAACVFGASVAMAGTGGPAAKLMGLVPDMPHDTKAAHAQWASSRHGLERGPQLARFYNALQSAMRAGTPSAAQMKKAADMAAYYQTPEGQEKIRHMSPDQMHALSVKMQAAMGNAPAPPVGPISEHDSALMDVLNANPNEDSLRAAINALNAERAALLVAWSRADDALDKEERGEHAKLPICSGGGGEATGGPDDIAERDLQLKFAGRHIALADRYLAKTAALVPQYRKVIGPEIAYADTLYANWLRIHDPGLKHRMETMVRMNVRSAFTDIGQLAGMIEDASRHSADRIEMRHAIEQQFAHAQGC